MAKRKTGWENMGKHRGVTLYQWHYEKTPGKVTPGNRWKATIRPISKTPCSITLQAASATALIKMVNQQLESNSCPTCKRPF